MGYQSIPLYTVIAFKDESCEYARGCTIASYEADFVKKTGLTSHEAKELVAKLRAKELEYAETGYEEILVFRTEPMLDFNGPDEDTQVAKKFREDILARTDEIVKAQKKEKKQKEIEAEKEKRAKKVQEDLKKLAELKEKYPDA